MAEPFVRASLDAERAVLGGVLLENELLARLAPLVAAADFYVPAHGLIFDAIGTIAGRGQPVDVITLANELAARDRLETVGGPQYLGALTDLIPTLANVEQYARLVRDHAAARRIEGAAMALVQAARDPARDAAALRALALEKLDALTALDTARTMLSYRDLAESFFAHLEATAARGPGIDGVTTGLAGLDELLAGLHAEELIVLGARPRVGKTSLAMQMCAAVARASRLPVLCFSLEMSALSLFARAACSAAGVEGSALRQGMLTQPQSDALTAALADLSELPVYLDDASTTTVADIRAQAGAMKARHGLSMVLVDYLQLLEATSVRGGTREREVAMMSRSLKMLARELKVPVVVLSQLNREVDKRPDARPVLSDLRESGALEQDSDVVIFLYRDALYHRDTPEPDVAEIIVAKQRNGPPDMVKVKWEGPFTRFSNLERIEPQLRLPVAPPADNFHEGPLGDDRTGSDW